MTEPFDQAQMWDERYREPGYQFGTEPSLFIAAHVGLLTPGSEVLCVGDGEGRNGVFLAEHGMRVSSFDVSAVAIAKAARLAADRGVSVDRYVMSIHDWDWVPDRYDAVVAIFIQFLGPGPRADAFAQMLRTLRPGGFLMLHGYTPEQIALGTGGPPLPRTCTPRSSSRRRSRGTRSSSSSPTRPSSRRVPGTTDARR